MKAIPVIVPLAGVVAVVALVVMWLRDPLGAVGILSISAATVMGFMTVLTLWSLPNVRLSDAVRAAGADAVMITAPTPHLGAALAALPMIDEWGRDANPEMLPARLVLAARPGYIELWGEPSHEPRLYLRVPHSDVVGVSADHGSVLVDVATDGPGVRSLAFPAVDRRFGLFRATARATQSRLTEIEDVLNSPGDVHLVARNSRRWRALRARVEHLADLDVHERDALTDEVIAENLRRLESGDRRGGVTQIRASMADQFGVDLPETMIDELVHDDRG